MQHINFFSQLERAVEPPFSARQQVVLLGSLFVILLFIYGVFQWQQSSLFAEFEVLKAEQLKVSNSLKSLTARKKALENNSELIAEISNLESAVKFRRQLMASINPKDQQGESGFSIHLNGLARQQLEGLWFTEISLTDRGEKMALSGYSRKPEYLPRYIQRLSAESVFEGQQFSVLRMHDDEKYRNTMRFEVRTNEKAINQ